MKLVVLHFVAVSPYKAKLVELEVHPTGAEASENLPKKEMTYDEATGVLIRAGWDFLQEVTHPNGFSRFFKK
jgi:hypothetical protein